jgi:microcystin-dependent protein
MAQFYVGEIILVPYTFAPVGFADCDGSLLPIAEYDALFNLIGTTYGGDGQETFALPNLQSRVPIHVGQGPGLSSYALGDLGGVDTVTLVATQLPSHSHGIDSAALAARMRCQSAAGTGRLPAGSVLAKDAAGVTRLYSSLPPDSDMRAGTIGLTAGAATIGITPQSPQAGHDNIQPILAMRFCISLFGIFPSPA